MQRRGIVAVDLQTFSLDYNDFMAFELRCNGDIVMADRFRGTFGRAFEIPAYEGCPYELKLAAVSNAPVITYHYRLSFDSVSRPPAFSLVHLENSTAGRFVQAQ